MTRVDEGRRQVGLPASTSTFANPGTALRIWAYSRCGLPGRLLYGRSASGWRQIPDEPVARCRCHYPLSRLHYKLNYSYYEVDARISHSEKIGYTTPERRAQLLQVLDIKE